ncbi:serine palmitoyltransferase 1 [Nannochloropsis oceanica]
MAGDTTLGDSFLDLTVVAHQVLRQFWRELTQDGFKEWVLAAPARYQKWWLNLVEHSPGHVVVETTLILFIIWLIFLRKTEDPAKDETFLTEQEIDLLVKEWKPEPLVPATDPSWDGEDEEALVIEEMQGTRVVVKEKILLNLASFDFLGLAGRPEVKDAARAALNKYGCGSCGPRGFYGSIDVHVGAEQAMAKFMGAEEAISYSDAASSVSSTLPAFAKKGDLLVVDDGVYEPIQTAINLSRAQVRWFRHNDMEDLKRVLEGVAREDARLGRNVLEQRRFVVVEGLYKNYGDLCPLPALVALKKEFCYRLYLDQTFSFGCFGKGGRGVAEHWGVDLGEIDIMSVSISHALGSVGGMCVGTHEVVDHQRLSGAGYCYSASAPPFTSSAAIAALELLEKEPGLVAKLQENASFLSRNLRKIPGLEVRSEEVSPILHVGLTQEGGWGGRKYEQEILREVSRGCVAGGYAVVTSKVTCLVEEREGGRGGERAGGGVALALPSLRLTVSAAHSQAELQGAVNVIRKVVGAALKKRKQSRG